MNAFLIRCSFFFLLCVSWTCLPVQNHCIHSINYRECSALAPLFQEQLYLVLYLLQLIWSLLYALCIQNSSIRAYLCRQKKLHSVILQKRLYHFRIQIEDHTIMYFLPIINSLEKRLRQDSSPIMLAFCLQGNFMVHIQSMQTLVSRDTTEECCSGANLHYFYTVSVNTYLRCNFSINMGLVS